MKSNIPSEGDVQDAIDAFVIGIQQILKDFNLPVQGKGSQQSVPPFSVLRGAAGTILSSASFL